MAVSAGSSAASAASASRAGRVEAGRRGLLGRRRAGGRRREQVLVRDAELLLEAALDRTAQDHVRARHEHRPHRASSGKSGRLCEWYAISAAPSRLTAIGKRYDFRTGRVTTSAETTPRRARRAPPRQATSVTRRRPSASIRKNENPSGVGAGDVAARAPQPVLRLRERPPDVRLAAARLQEEPRGRGAQRLRERVEHQQRVGRDEVEERSR
jgi:hypothetical protein